MTDLVDRLRDVQEWERAEGSIRLEAADEIERLRARILQLRPPLRRQKTLEQCVSADPDEMCDGCDCWKQTRAACS